MEEKKEVIEISIELQKEIARTYEVTQRSVQSAMRFETNSPSARLYRLYALNNGGERYEITIIKKRIENSHKEVITE